MIVFTKITDRNYPLKHSRNLFLFASDACTENASNSTQTYILSILDNKNITTNQNKNNISYTDCIQSCVIPQKQNYIIQVTSPLTRLTPLNDTLPILFIKLHTPTKLPLPGKEYFCFHINS